ncbi:HupE/UreJ family protein [Asticcacaulis sp. 201]|uniref:HupE/UreJ family protein n=1 Tax=Asticcacaulis sp. 201 TaxID=3028787 RepID=UPI002916C2C8|nr:HupE/UreJ family protein [Asticcacaulis sp. 201]MDV6331152.1 HupE/UreJ family protein [Asticcacaulis sp. 201]
MSLLTPRTRPLIYTDKAGFWSHVGINFPVHLAAAMVVTLAAVAMPADAHVGTGLAGGFVSGFLHPLTGWDHLLAMVSVGLWGAILGRPLIVALPVIFPSMMVIGAFLGMLNAPMPPVEIGIALSVLLLGAVIAFGYKAPSWMACIIVAIFALFHGFAHGKELPSAADPVGYSTGFVLSTGLLHVCGIIIGLINSRPKGRWVVKGLGAAITLAGCVFMAQAVM